jgi:hypothetical protein
VLRDYLDNGASIALELVLFDTFFIPGSAGDIADPPMGALPRGRHAVLAAGHNVSSLLIRNSWGNTWGLNGYAWLSDGYVLRHGRSAWVIDSNTRH